MRKYSEIPQDLVSSEIGEIHKDGIEYGLHLMQLIADIEGTKLSRKQELAASAIGGAMNAFDDAFDKYDIRSAQERGEAIRKTVSGIDDGETLSPVVSAGIKIARDNLNETAFTALQEVTQAQIESIRQREEDVTLDEIKTIERKKGCGTLLLFALEVNPNLSERRRRCYQELGYLVQLIDDFQDAKKDRAEGIKTIITLSVTTPEAIQTVVQQRDKVKTMFSAQYEQHKLINLFSYIDKAMVGSGIIRPQ